MNLTSNETAWVIMIIVLIHSSFMTWLAVSIKSEEDKNNFIKKSKTIFFKLLMVFSIGFSIYILIYEAWIDTPIKRADIFLILSAVSLIFLSIILCVVRSMLRATEVYSAHLKLTEHILENLNP